MVPLRDRLAEPRRIGAAAGTCPAQAGWYDVKLPVGGAGHWNSPAKWASFRQVEPNDFFPTYYPAIAPPTEPQPAARTLRCAHRPGAV